MAKCIICGSSELSEKIFFDSYPLCIGVQPPELFGKVESFPLTLGSCDQCVHLQQMNPVADEHNDVLYGSENSGLLSSVSIPSKTNVGLVEAQNSFNFFKDCNLPKGKVLDIGCCDGYFLSLLKAQGYDVQGVEPNAIGDVAQKKYGIPITKDYFSAKYFEENSFDIIILRNILEHMSDANGFLEEVYKILKLGGYIFIEVPNSALSLREGHVGCFFHQHLSYFSLGTILHFLSRHSLEHVHSLEDYFMYLCVKKNVDAKPVISSNNDQLDMTHQNIDKYFEGYNRKKKDLNALLEKEDNVAFFGAGGHTTGLTYMIDEEFRKKIKFVYDNNPLKHGNFLSEIPIEVRDPKYIKSDNPDVLIISTYLHQAELLDQAQKMGVPDLKIVTVHSQVRIVNQLEGVK